LRRGRRPIRFAAPALHLRVQCSAHAILRLAEIRRGQTDHRFDWPTDWPTALACFSLLDYSAVQAEDDSEQQLENFVVATLRRKVAVVRNGALATRRRQASPRASGLSCFLMKAPLRKSTSLSSTVCQISHGPPTHFGAMEWCQVTEESTGAWPMPLRRTSRYLAAHSAKQCCKICKVMDLAIEGWRAGDRPERFRGRAHPGRRGVARGAMPTSSCATRWPPASFPKFRPSWDLARAERSIHRPLRTSPSWSKIPVICL